MTGTSDPGVDAAAARGDEVETAAAEPIEIPGGGQIRVGTASWTDPTMTASGVFYPAAATTAEERLHHYAATFPLVEVDATYYALPAAIDGETVGRADAAGLRLRHQGARADDRPGDRDQALAEGDPHGAARARRQQDTDLRQGPARRAARRGLAHVPRRPRAARDGGQLGSILLQYPRWFFPSSENRAAIEAAVERLDGWAAAVEFRNGSWLNEKNAERTLRFLRDRKIAFVMVDEPQGFKSSVPPTVAVTSDLALVRFHGRNAETWEAKGITPAERFRYLYSRDELAEWVAPIRHAASEAKDTHVLMNNCYANYGTTNARELAALLSGELSD